MQVNVCIGAKGPYPFILDTGRTSSSIASTLAEELKLPTVGKEESFSGAGGCTATSQGARVGNWSASGVRLGAQRVDAVTIAGVGGEGEPKGLLGADVWSRFWALRIDFAGRSVTVGGPLRPRPAKETIVKRASSKPLPSSLVTGSPTIVAPMQTDIAPGQTSVLVQLRIGDSGQLDFTPDTGASLSVVDTAEAKKLALADANSAAQENTVCSVITVPEVQSGPWSLAEKPLQPQTVGTVELVQTTRRAGVAGLRPDESLRIGRVPLRRGPAGSGSGLTSTVRNAVPRQETAVLITTGNDLPGYEITEVLGETFGLTVRSRHAGSQIGAAFKSLAGGELKGMTKMLQEGREEAIERLVEEAQGKGADAIVAMRFDSSEFMENATEICAYGTAVRARRSS